MPVTVSEGFIQHHEQRKTFFANGYYWDFYSDGVNAVYRTSADAVVWSAPAVAIAGVTKARWFSVRQYNYAGTEYFYFGWVTSETWSGALKFRRDTISGSSLVAGAERTVFAGHVSIRLNNPDLEVGTDGYIHVGVSYGDNSGVKILSWRLYRCSDNSGNCVAPWTSTFFVFAVGVGDLWYGFGGLTRLNSGRVYSVYVCFAAAAWVRGTLWTGVWSAFETINNFSTFDYFGLASYGDDVYFTYSDGTFGLMYCKVRTYGVGWGAAENVDLAVISFSGGTLCVDSSTGDVYVFRGYTSDIRRCKRSGGVWGAVSTWVAGEFDLLVYSIVCFPRVVSNKIGVSWQCGITTVYVRYNVLDITPLPKVKSGLHPSKVVSLLTDG